MLTDGSSIRDFDSDEERYGSTDHSPGMTNKVLLRSANRTRRQFAGSIVVSLNIEFNPTNADKGNKTMYIRHLHQALRHPDFLRRFQEAMREEDTPVVVAWTEYVHPAITFSAAGHCDT